MSVKSKSVGAVRETAGPVHCGKPVQGAQVGVGGARRGCGSGRGLQNGGVSLVFGPEVGFANRREADSCVGSLPTEG